MIYLVPRITGLCPPMQAHPRNTAFYHLHVLRLTALDTASFSPFLTEAPLHSPSSYRHSSYGRDSSTGDLFPGGTHPISLRLCRAYKGWTGQPKRYLADMYPLGSDRFDALPIVRLFGCVPQVVILLQIEPKLRRRLERPG